MVMPRSRSRSLESIARSATFWFSRNEPDCCSRRSTSVVLPWSTWAMMATLRRFIQNPMVKNATAGRGPAVRVAELGLGRAEYSDETCGGNTRNYVRLTPWGDAKLGQIGLNAAEKPARAPFDYRLPIEGPGQGPGRRSSRESCG